MFDPSVLNCQLLYFVVLRLLKLLSGMKDKDLMNHS